MVSLQVHPRGLAGCRAGEPKVPELGKTSTAYVSRQIMHARCWNFVVQEYNDALCTRLQDMMTSALGLGCPLSMTTDEFLEVVVVRRRHPRRVGAKDETQSERRDGEDTVH